MERNYSIDFLKILFALSIACGQKPVFSILMEHFIHRCAYAAVQRKAHRGPLRSAILFLLL